MQRQRLAKSAGQIRLAIVSCLLLVAWLASANLHAAEEKKPTYEKRKASALISADVYDEMIKAQEAQEKGNIKEALAILDKLKARTGKKALKPYERAQMWNFYAYAWLAQDNYPKAITAFENLLEQEDVPDGLALSTRFTLAQLHFAEGDVKKAIAMFEAWFKEAEKPGPDAYVTLAQAYTQNDQIDKALKQVLKAFDVAKAQKREPKENWYSLLQYIYAEKKMYNKQIEVLEILVDRWPKRNYWLALVGAYGQQDMEDKQLAAMDAAYVQGMLDQEGYLVTYAQMLAADDVPYKAAKVMDKALQDEQIKADAKNLERTGEYYRRSKELEKALPFLEKASEMAEDGQTAMRLSYVYMSRYRYKDAAAMLQKALQKGGLSNPLQARLLLGQAYFHADDFDNARKTLKSLIKLAGEKENTNMADKAGQWLKYLDSEIKRQQEIKKYLEG